MSKLNFLARYGSGKHIDAALIGQSDVFTKEAALRNPNITKGHISNALHPNQHWQVREAAIMHPNITKEQVMSVSNDNDPDIRSIVQDRLKDFK